MKFDIIATTTFGLEALVKKELEDLGYKDLKVSDGKIELQGEAKDIAILNIHLRCAERVLIKVGQFKAYTFDELFEKTKALPWENIIPADGEFPVNGKSVKSKLFSISDCQSIV